jgi:dTDP-4-amino-4,6-dideoxygalactose transaminase
MSVAVDRIPIARPYVDASALDALRECFDTGWFTMGPAVAEFEQGLADVVGTGAVACSSCTAGIHLALLAWGIGPGDEVVVPAYSFVASAHAVAQTGATPVFCDVDPETAQIDPDAAAAAITQRTRAIMPVHLFGIPAPMDAVGALAARHGLEVIEDAACALGATYRGVPCGALGDAASFSFHPRKVITTGEGGALTSRDEALLDQARAQRNHGAKISGFDRHQAGQGAYPTFDFLGFNYRLTDLQARLGLAQLPKLSEILALRRGQAARYTEAFAGLEGLEPLVAPPGGDPCWQSYAVRVLEQAPVGPAQLREHLHARGIQAVQSAQLIPALDYYRAHGDWAPGRFPGAEHLDAVSVSIPLYAGLTEGEQARVVDGVREAWS